MAEAALNVRKQAEEMKASLQDLSAWTQGMQAQALASGTPGSRKAGLVGVAEEPRPADREASLVEKEKGNVYFQRAAYPKAVQCYARALERDASNVAAYSNKAAAHLKLGEWAEARAACSQGLEREPKHVKMLWRRAIASRELGLLAEAQADLDRAKVLEPGNKAVAQELDLLRQLRKPVEMVQPTTGSAQRRRLFIEEIGTGAGYAAASSSIPVVSVPSPAPLANVDGTHSSSPSSTPAPSPLAVSNAKWMAELEAIATTIPKKAPAPAAVPPSREKSPVASASPGPGPDFPVPENLLEFERDWRTLQGRGVANQVSYLLAIPGSRYAKLFRTGLEGDYLTGAVAALAAYPSRHRDMLGVLEGLAQCPRFEMALLFCSRAEREVTRQLLASLADVCEGEDDRAALAALHAKYKVPMKSRGSS